MDIDNKDTEFIMPGDVLSELIYSKVDGNEAKFVIGPGLVRNQQKITAVKPGTLESRENPTVFWIDSHQRRVRFYFCVTNLFIQIYYSMSRLTGSE